MNRQQKQLFHSPSPAPIFQSRRLCPSKNASESLSAPFYDDIGKSFNCKSKSSCTDPLSSEIHTHAHHNGSIATEDHEDFSDNVARGATINGAPAAHATTLPSKNRKGVTSHRRGRVMTAFDSTPYYKQVQPHVTCMKKKTFDHMMSSEMGVPKQELDRPRVYASPRQRMACDKEAEEGDVKRESRKKQVTLVLNTIYRGEISED